MFSNMKKEKIMESELSDIFWVKVIAKNIPLGSLGTQRQAVFAIWCLFLKKHANFQNQTVCLINWAYPFMGPRRPISCSKVAKIFHAYEG